MPGLGPVGPLKRSLVTRSPEETRDLGLRLGRLLQPGDFVGLVGDLGAGKTHFARGVAEGAGVDPRQVASPTFAIVYPYEGDRVRLYHADLYRVADYDELYATGFTDLLGPDGAVLVEWLDRVPEAAPGDAVIVTISRPPELGDEERAFEVEATGGRSAELLEAWIPVSPQGER